MVIRSLTPKTLFLFLCIFTYMHSVNAAQASPFKPYALDASHTKVGFEISHLVIATVDGQFDKFSGAFDYNPQTHEIKNATISIDVASINTNEPDRDKHLRSKDFFDVEKNPHITFENAKLVTASGKPNKLQGTLNMHAVKKPISLDVDFKGSVTDPWGNQKIVFNLRGKVMRKDFGLNWNKALDAGGLMIGDEVTIIIKAEANLKQ